MTIRCSDTSGPDLSGTLRCGRARNARAGSVSGGGSRARLGPDGPGAGDVRRPGSAAAGPTVLVLVGDLVEVRLGLRLAVLRAAVRRRARCSGRRVARGRARRGRAGLARRGRGLPSASGRAAAKAIGPKTIPRISQVTGRRCFLAGGHVAQVGAEEPEERAEDDRAAEIQGGVHRRMVSHRDGVHRATRSGLRRAALADGRLSGPGTAPRGRGSRRRRPPGPARGRARSPPGRRPAGPPRESGRCATTGGSGRRPPSSASTMRLASSFV